MGGREVRCWYWPLLLLWLVQRPVTGTAARLLMLGIIGWLAVSFVADISSDGARPAGPRPDYGRCDEFMVETGRAARLTTPQACAIESAAHHHPNHTVCLAVLTDDGNFSWTGLRRRLRSVDNLKVMPLELVDLARLFEWSPVKEVWRGAAEQVRESSWSYAHTARLARQAWLWQYGGLALDSDMLLVTDLLKHNGSFVAMQSLSPENGISSAVAKLSRHHPLLLDWLDRAAQVYDPGDRGAWGDELVTAVTLDFCSEELEVRGGREPGRKDDLSVLESRDCQSSLEVLPYTDLFPVAAANWKEIFVSGAEEAKRMARVADSARAVHLWQERSRVVQVENMREDSGFVALSREHCPMVYYREIHGTVPKKKKGLKANEMKLILNWKLAGEAEVALKL
jgi:hypothetical protein